MKRYDLYRYDVVAPASAALPGGGGGSDPGLQAAAAATPASACKAAAPAGNSTGTSQSGRRIQPQPVAPARPGHGSGPARDRPSPARPASRPARDRPSPARPRLATPGSARPGPATARAEPAARPGPATAEPGQLAAPSTRAVCRRLPAARRAGHHRAPQPRKPYERPVPSVTKAFTAEASAPLMRAEPPLPDIPSHSGIRWEALAACDSMRMRARARCSQVAAGEKLGAVNHDGTMLPDEVRGA